MRSRRAVLIGGAASVVVLSAATLSPAPVGLAAVTGGISSAASNGKGSNGNPPNKALTVVGGDITGLAPGAGPRSLGVVVSNPKNNTGAVRVDSVKAKVESVSKPGCTVGVDVPPAQQGSFHVLVTSYTAPATGPGITLDKNDSKLVPVMIEMLNLPISQDACKLAKINLSYVATATSK